MNAPTTLYCGLLCRLSGILSRIIGAKIEIMRRAVAVVPSGSLGLSARSSRLAQRNWSNPACHDAEAARIEVTEIDDVDGHGRNLTRRLSLRRAENGIAV